MNEITIYGNLTKDVELYKAKNKDSIATMTVAVNRNADETDFFTVKAFGKQADNASEYLAKGKGVVVHGSMQERKFDKKDGTKGSVWELIARQIKYV